MGKLVHYLSILIFVDLLFIVTGQVCVEGACSISSILFSALFDLPNMTASTFFKQLIGDLANLTSSGTGVLSLVGGVVGAVTLGALSSKSDTLLFIPIAVTLATIGSDFIFIFSHLSKYSLVLATFIIAPMFVLYIVTAMEWLKNKD